MGFIGFLQAVVQLVQQWLCTNGQPTNPVVVAHTSLDFSAGLQNTPKS